MRRSYEFQQESYIVDNSSPYKSFHVPTPTFHNMHDNSKLDHYEPLDNSRQGDDYTTFNERGPRVYYCDDNYYVDHDVKKNEHHGMGSKTILRPPLGSVVYNVPSHHHNHRTMFNDDKYIDHGNVNRNEHHGMGSKTLLQPPQACSRNIPSQQYHHQAILDGGQKPASHDNSWRNNNGAIHDRYGDYGEYDSRGGKMHGELESLVKKIEAGGRKVEKIEVIEYETKRYVPGAYHEWRVYGTRSSPSYPKTSSWFKGY